MKALTIDKFGGIEEMKWSDLPIPSPKSNEVQIKITHAAVNPVDWKICEGFLQKLIPHAFPLITGWDASGTISSIGVNVTSFSIGDEVHAYCRKPTIQWGTYADYICFDAVHVAPKPKLLTLAEAAAIPLAALTAWQSLFDIAHLKKGQTILVHAGAGGVGSFAIQFSKHIGAKVYTTASESNHEYVKILGADVAIDYRNNDFTSVIKELEPNGVDIVYDCVGYDTLESSYSVVKKGGCLVSIVNKPNSEKCIEHEVKGEFAFVTPNGTQLELIGELIDKEKVLVPTITEMPIKDYAKAWKQIKTHHTQGKIVLKI